MIVRLNGEWRVRAKGDADWLPAKVPGSVLCDLLAAGRIPDPYYRENERIVRAATVRDYEYERLFEVEDGLLGCDRIWLICRGLDTLADVYLNGQWVGHACNMHRTHEFPVKPLLRKGTNHIRVVFRSPVPYIANAHASDPLWGAPEAMAGFPHLRKAHFMFGWDWAPTLPDMGIWRDISLQGFCAARLSDVRVDQHHDAGRVRLTVHTAVERWTDDVLDVTVCVDEPGGRRWLRRESIETAQAIHVEVEQPRLWWPNGCGERPLYAVTVKLHRGGEVLDERRLRIGLRTLRLVREADAWGESFAFEVNGVRLFARGANYVPEDSLLGRLHPERTRRLLSHCADAHFNCIRVWGGGLYPDDDFYDACDELGLLVWQDFMFACGVYRLTPAFAEEVCREAQDVVRRIRHHPSLALLCGNNEMEWAWTEWTFPKTDDLRQDYLRLFEQILPEVVRREAPQTAYWPASPSSGGGFDRPNDENRGDVHYWDVWHGQKPFAEYRRFYFRFCSEFGFQSLPAMPTIESFTEPEDRNVFSPVMEHHQKNGASNGNILFHLSRHFRYPKDLSSLAFVSQILQAEAVRCGVEHWRRHRGRCMGALYWQLNDCWPVASWSSIDYNGHWKPLHYFARRFFHPLLLSAWEDGCRVSLWLTNDTLADVSGTVRWCLRDARSNVLREGALGARAPALSSVCAVDLDFEGMLGWEDRRQVYLEYWFTPDEWDEEPGAGSPAARGNRGGITGGAGGDTVFGGTVLFVPAKHFAFQPPALSVHAEDWGERYAVHVRSEAFAKYVAIRLAGADAVFGDNFFDLSAGGSRIVTVKKAALSRPLTLAEFQQRLRLISLYDTYHHE
ncbi:MAG: glycoside hydrolase family 2 protein [Alicyclobacillaceae bacterium]|nr:glycoside hydrolase family 2 protein [Alicyclobacillaceae bacterium]